MKTTLLTVLLVSIVALSACGMPSVVAPAPTATSAPAKAPAAAPTTPPAEPAATAEEQSVTPGDTSEEENPVEEATIETSPLAALAEQNIGKSWPHGRRRCSIVAKQSVRPDFHIATQ